ncbi:MAG: DUF5686 and carboxypeptidase regulatory-like domain-containing protein [Oscillibacter sp.]|nr:DUF5686 and carboxypeptidase regulatory-like domain-containing protein [Oscillibacter sp.]
MTLLLLELMMKGVFYCCLLLLGIVFRGEAQSLRGRITDRSGVGIPGATLYVREVAAGAVADENGDFQMKLSVGRYTCEISSVGYERQVRQLEVKAEEVLRLNVQLQEMKYMLKEVKVTRRKEDPAYYFMRHAIARAPFHLNQVKRYGAEIYTKGAMQLEKMPKVLMWSKEIREEVTPYIGKLFVQELVTDLKFEAPDRYEQKILAFSSTIPEDMEAEDALEIISASIYDPKVIGMVSPLASGAFSYYRFHLEEYYEEGGRNVAKIKVIPRKNNRLLMSGWLCVVEDDWCVTGFDLLVKHVGVTAGIKCMFHEVKPSVFLPTSYDIDMKVSLLGLRAGGKYYAALTYKEVELQEETDAGNVVPEFAEGKEVKKQEQLERLLEKDDLSTREAYRAARLMQEQQKPKRRDTVAPLEIRDSGVQVKTSLDSNALKRDSLYWSQMRTVPLKQEEIVSYRRKDSVNRNVVGNAERGTDTLRKYSRNRTGSVSLLGGNVELGKRVNLQVDGLLKAVPEYNFVDGFWVGQKVTLSIGLKAGRRLEFVPSLYYATARKAWLWEMKGQYAYAPVRRGVLTAGIGYVSADYKGETESSRWVNALTSLVCADNYMKFYNKRYVSFRNAVDLANGLRLDLAGRYEKRQVLSNHTTYNFFKRKADLNFPSEEGGVDMPDNTSLVFDASLEYTPFYYYRMKHGKKVYEYSKWPTFSLGYGRGISLNDGHDSSFERIALGVRQDVRCSYFDRFSYYMQVGKFFTVKEVYFPDYKHFNTTGWILNMNGFSEGFFVADYYELHTNDKWVYGGANYISSYLLLKRLSFMQRLLFDEALHVRYLWTPLLRNYVETGYSLGFSDVARGGVFVGFDGGGYKWVGVRFTLSLDKL